MQELPQISEAEYEIMKLLWDDSPLSTNEVCQRAQQTRNWSQKTIHTLLSRLTAKKAISYQQQGRMYYYSPLISQESYLRQENHHFLDRFYDGKAVPMVSSLISNSQLSDADLQNLYDLINTKLEQGDRQ